MFTDLGLRYYRQCAAAEKRLAFGEVVSGNYFSALGVTPAVGRGFRPDEEQGEGTHPVTVISDRLWRKAFGARVDVLGQPIVIKNRTYSIVGVAPVSFTGMMPGVLSELWIPISMVSDVEPAGNNDVVADVEAQARRIVAHCGLSWTDACLAFHKTKRPVQTASASQVRKPIYKSSIGRWRPYAELLAPLLNELKV